MLVFKKFFLSDAGIRPLRVEKHIFLILLVLVSSTLLLNEKLYTSEIVANISSSGFL